jgi:Zn-dependent protease
MFLLEPGRTAYDLNWRMFGIDVRVHPMFWLIGAVMGFARLEHGFGLFFVWMACFFVSILVHEMGHIVMGKFCGSNGHIVLYAFGGLAIPHRVIYIRWQRIAVSFAGPLAGFMLFVLVAMAYFALGGVSLPVIGTRLWTMLGIQPHAEEALALDPLVQEAFYDLLWINLVWGLVNLLPIWPLDGGQISREIFEGMIPDGRGLKASLAVSCVLAVLVAVQCLTAAWGHALVPFLPGFGTYAAILFGLLAFESFQLLQQLNRPRRRPWDDGY